MSEPARTQRFTEPDGTTVEPLPDEATVLAVGNDVGEISLHGADWDDIRISWVRRGEPATTERDGIALEVDRSPGRIAVRPRRTGQGAGAGAGARFVIGAGSPWLDLRIELPRSAPALSVEIENGAGSVEAGDLSCRAIRLAVAAGSVRLRGIAADIRIESASGDVEAAAIAGDLAVRSASGDIAIPGHLGGTLAADTASGDVRWRPQGPSQARIRTVSGDVVAELPSGAGWRVEFRSVSGAASMPPRFAREGRKTWAAPGASTGMGSIEARSVSGGFRVVDLDASAGAAPGRDERGAPSGRAAILEAVERGEVGVEDALRLLDDLQGGAQPA